MKTVVNKIQLYVGILSRITLLSILLTLMPGFMTFAFAQATVTLTLVDGVATEADQNSGSFSVTRSDDDGLTEDLVVRVAISGTAERDIDYSRPGLDWPGGEDFFITIPAQQASKTITLTPYKDNLAEVEEIATFTLLELGDTYAIGVDSEVNVAITDDTDHVFGDGFGLPNPMPPIDVLADLANDNSVSASIGAEGGVLSTPGSDGSSYELTVPPNALQQPVTITVTPINSLTAAPFAESLAASFVAGVQLEPSGLQFMRPLELKIVPTGGIDPSVWAWSYDGEGESLYPVPFTVDGDSVNMDIWHFSGWGISIDWNEVIQTFGSSLAVTAEQLAAAAIQNATSDPNAINIEALIDTLRNWYISSVRPLLVNAKTNPALALPSMTQWLNWKAELLKSGVDVSSLDSLVEESNTLARSVLDAAFEAAILECDGAGNLQEAFEDFKEPLNWILRAQENGWGNDYPIGELEKCAAVKVSDATYPARLDNGETGELKVRVGVAFRGAFGWTRYDMEPEVTMTNTGISADPPSGFADNDGWFTTTLTMESDENATVELTASTEIGPNGQELYESTNSETYTIKPKTSLSLLGKPESGGSFSESVTIEPMEQATIQATVFFEAAPSINKTVNFTLEGEGDLIPLTPVLTDNDGLATIRFAAPAEAGQSTITATHTTDTAKELTDTITISYGASVEISPVAVLVNAGGTIEFTATTTNLSPEKVKWSSGYGTTIPPTGDLTATWTAPADAGSYEIKAKWVDDETIKASALATVELSGEPAGQFAEGFYYGRRMVPCEFDPEFQFEERLSECPDRIERNGLPAWMHIYSEGGSTKIELYDNPDEACGWRPQLDPPWQKACQFFYPHYTYRAYYPYYRLTAGSVGATTTIPAQSADAWGFKCYLGCLSGANRSQPSLNYPSEIRFGINNVTWIEERGNRTDRRWIFVKDDERDPFGEWAFDPRSLETPEEYYRD